jgi:hypothetical protein
MNKKPSLIKLLFQAVVYAPEIDFKEKTIYHFISDYYCISAGA